MFENSDGLLSRHFRKAVQKFVKTQTGLKVGKHRLNRTPRPLETRRTAESIGINPHGKVSNVLIQCGHRNISSFFDSCFY